MYLYLLCSYCSESSVVEESHRQSLVPILIRLGDGILLYGIDVVVLDTCICI